MRTEPTIPANLHLSYADLAADPVPHCGRLVGGSAADRQREQAQLPAWACRVLAWSQDADVEAFQRAERAADLRPASRPRSTTRSHHGASLRLVRSDAVPVPDATRELRRAARWARGRADGLAWWVRHLPTLAAVHAHDDRDAWRITVHRHVVWGEALAQLERRGGQRARASGWWRAVCEVRTLLNAVSLTAPSPTPAERPS